MVSDFLKPRHNSAVFSAAVSYQHAIQVSGSNQMLLPGKFPWAVGSFLDARRRLKVVASSCSHLPEITRSSMPCGLLKAYAYCLATCSFKASKAGHIL